ncbi:MAG: formyl transferase [Pseudohongiellaceae bacterium]
MNITILTNRDLASCFALNRLIPGLTEHQVTVFLSSRVGSKTLAVPLQHLKFVEQDLLNGLIAPLLDPDTSGPLREGQTLLSFEQLGARITGGVSTLNAINETAGLKRYAESEPDLVLSVRYGVILRDPAISLPKHGVLNLHSGLLPDYKGVMATFWALLNKEPEIGTTLHFIEDSSIDTGSIVTTTRLPVQPDRSYLWHVLSLYESGCARMLEAVEVLDRGLALERHAQPDSGNYFSFPDDAALKKFAKQGGRLFEPDEVLNVLRQFIASAE